MTIKSNARDKVKSNDEYVAQLLLENSALPSGVPKDTCTVHLLPASSPTLLLPTATAMTQTAPQRKSFNIDAATHRLLSRMPWFLLLMCFVQISLYLIANGCVHRRLIYMPDFKHEYWRFITYMLLHSDHLHLWLNMGLQCLIGLHLELEQGHYRFALVYLAGGVSGSLATAWLQPNLSLLGASAGVYAILLSHIPHLIKNFSQLSYRLERIVSLVILCLSDVCFTAFHFLVNHNTNPRICLEAHVAGGMAGLLCGFIVYHRLQRPHWTAPTACTIII